MNSCSHKGKDHREFWVRLGEPEMISKTDKEAILEISRRYRAKRVLLFGSSLRPDKESRDIDIAVEGIPDRDFFSYYGDLMFALSKPVDVVDLSGRSKFTSLIQEEGILLYGGS